MILYFDTTDYSCGEATTVAYAGREQTAWEPAGEETEFVIAGDTDPACIEDEESEILNPFVAMVVPPGADLEDAPNGGPPIRPVVFPSGFV